MVSPATRAARYLLDHRQPPEALMIERGIGYWISPAGEAVPTPPRVSHAQIMRELIDRTSLGETDREAFDVDPNAFAQRQGWTRVRIYPGQQVAYVDFGAGRQAMQRQAVHELLEQLDLPHVQVKFTDDQGNYVSP